MADPADTYSIPSPGFPPVLYVGLLVFVAWIPVAFALTAWTFGVGAIAPSLGLSTPATGGHPAFFGFFIWVLGVGGIALSILLMLWITPIRIDADPGGVTFVSRLRKLKVAWQDLRPHTVRQRGEWGTMIGGFYRWGSPRILWVRRTQVRALLEDSRSPRALFPPEYWRWVELSPPS